jgi:hypothetical protein
LDVNGLFVRSEAPKGRSASAPGRFFLVTQEADSVAKICLSNDVLDNYRRAASYVVAGSNVTTVRYTELASDRFKDFWR